MADRIVLIRLTDIRDEISGIKQLTAGANAETFAANWAMKRAVQHALLIIAEAAKHIPNAMKETRPEVPWRQIHGLGNLLRHEYQRVDAAIVWSVVSDHLDALDAAAAALSKSASE